MDPKPQYLDFTTINGIGIIVHADQNHFQLSQDVLVAIRRGATAYLQCIFTPDEAQSFKKNSIYWDIPYMRTQLGFVPTPFQVHNGTLYIHYYPSAVPLYREVGALRERSPTSAS